MLAVRYLGEVSNRALKLQKQFGESVRVERLKRRMSQEAVALESGLSLTYVGEIERGEKMASLDTIVRLADALGLKGADLLEMAER